MSLDTSSKRYASLAQAAQYLGCDERTIRRCVARGELRGYRLGSRIIRVDLNEVDAIMKPIPTAGGGGLT